MGQLHEYELDREPVTERDALPWWLAPHPRPRVPVGRWLGRALAWMLGDREVHTERARRSAEVVAQHGRASRAMRRQSRGW